MERGNRINPTAPIKTTAVPPTEPAMPPTTPPQIDLRDLQVLRLEPGDVLVFTTQAGLTMEHADRIRTVLLDRFPGHENVVISGGATLGVMRPSEEPS